jgi:cystathionine gamma-synthase
MDDSSDVDEEISASEQEDRDPIGDSSPETRWTAGIDLELRADAARRLQRAMSQMDRFLLRAESHSLGSADPTRKLCEALCSEARRLVAETMRECDGPTRESTLRSAYRLAGSLANLVAWSAPASQESGALNSFPVVAARDVVAYARYGSDEIAAQEVAYLAMLGFDPTQARLLLTSSGMAAYALIETFLLREVLRPADRVVLHPGIYFETRQQLQSLPVLDVKIARGGGGNDMLDAIAAHQPSVVFVDPLTHSSELRVINLPRLLDAAEGVCRHVTWFIVDGTLLSGSFDPFTHQSPRRKVRVLYYESGCKYMQFGMDLGPAGVVVVEASLAQQFDQLRRGIGAIASETLVLPRASRSAYLGYLRAQTACARAVAKAILESSAEGEPIIECSFPSEASHPDHSEALRYSHLGGIVVFRFLEDRFNRRRPLECFIDNLLASARLQNLPLTAGVSFGFRVPRIGLACLGYDSDDAYLRLSAGVSVERAAQLGRLIVQGVREFQ